VQTNAIASFDDVNTDKVSLIALGNADVPVGQYAQEIFTNMGVWDNIQGKISFGTNVKEVLSQVAAGSVDCGVVYATDAATATGVKVVCQAPDNKLKTPVVYPAAMLGSSQNPQAAKAFLDYLLTDNAKSEFKKVGFEIDTDKTSSNLSATGSCTLNIYAAASLKESLTAIQALFNAKYPNIQLSFNFDSSGTLQTQIEQGAPADVFISAAQKQMNTLASEGYIDASTQLNLLDNKVVLIVPDNK
jgi:ABC-type molybdate transport system substrate-binding protein